VAKGVVRDAAVQRRVVRRVIDAAREWGGVAAGVVDSGLPGPKGNREFFVHLVDRPDAPSPDDIDRWIHDAVGA
jgi:23S rRNA (cytidine1920-2'-O)/16S rRNA (cytidine1409-2'-O)-methyltransferase